MDTFEKIIISASDNPALSLIVFNSNGKLEWMSRGFKKMHDCDLPVEGAQTPSNIFNLYSSPDVKDILHECIQEKHPVDFISEIRTTKGASKWIQTFISPRLNSSNTPDQFLSLIHI